MPEEFVYYRNTQDRLEDEHETEAMQAADEAKVAIEYDQFTREVPGFHEIATNLGYDEDNDLGVEEDWSVSFNESSLDGVPCRIFCHTACDFYFLPLHEARRRAEAFAQAENAVDWQRKTGYGPGRHADPTAKDFD